MLNVVALVLTPDKLRRLSKQSFERFCRALLDADYHARFARGAVELAGPHLEDVGDGGRDLEAIIKKPARDQAFHPLLRDDEGEIFFSCKSHKDSAEASPRRWIEQARRDIDPQPSVFDGTGPAPNAAENARRTKPSLEKLLRRLCSGAHFSVLINVPWVDRFEVARDFALRLRTRAKLLLGEDVDIHDDQVRVLDANELISAFTERPSSLPSDLEQELGSADDDFRDWSGWTAHVESERRRLDFVHDEHREALHEQLERMVHEEAPASIWIVGAPGVGKTRAVHHFFELHTELHGRIRQTEDWEDAQRWIQRDGPRSVNDAIIVIDEVPSTRGDDLAREFRRKAHETRSKLVMIGTGTRGQDTRTKVFRLERLEPTELRSLIESELDGTSSEDTSRGHVIEVVERLSQGYPLFAMWLTRGLAEHPELLDAPGRDLTDLKDPWWATCFVLASRSEHSNDQEWQEVADRRGRALLLSMLAADEPWSFSPELEGQFERALGLSWHELEIAAEACRTRGILRETRRGTRYVSPANLERLLLNHYFGGTPSPILERLRSRLGSRVDGLLRRAQRVQASATCRRNLASALLEPSLEELRTGARGRGSLLRIARELPAELARRAHPIALRASPGSPLAAELASAFRHLRHRDIDRETFALVEDALFVLEGEQTWAWIFASGFHGTYQPFDFRLGLLEARLASREPGHRLRAVAGLRIASDPRGGPSTSGGLDDVDAATADPWELPSIEECAKRAAKGWALLLRAANDEDPAVSDAARHEITDGLRQGLEYGLWARPELLEELVAMVRGWTPSQRNALDAQLDDVERYDAERLSGAPPGQQAALRALRAALRPSTFEERLIAQVGRWHPISGPIDDAAERGLEAEGDRALARELVSNPSTLPAVQDWLGSHEAVRGTAFGWALGDVDEQLVLLVPLLACVEKGALRSVFTSYLAAWAGRAPSGFDAWIATHSSRPGLTDAIATAIVWAKSSPERATVLTEMVRRGSVRPTALRGLGSWGWSKGLPTGVLDRLLSALIDAGDVMMTRHAVGLAQERLEATPLDPAIAPYLIRAVNETRSVHLPGTGERAWAFVVSKLVEGGYLDALDVVVDAVGDVGHSHQAEQAIQELLRGGHVLELWPRLASRLADDPIFAFRLATLTETTPFRQLLPVDAVMDWVAGDPRRATTAARLTRPHGSVLDPLAVSLIERFGADAGPAREIEARACSTPGAVNSLARFFEQQAVNAAQWERDHPGEVARWAQSLAASLRERAAMEREEDQLSRHMASQ